MDSTSKPSRPPFVFDGCGINGPDEYCSRLATLTKAGHALNIGPKLADLLNARPSDQSFYIDALRDALSDLRRNVDVSTINNSKRSTARWTELVIQAEAALALPVPAHVTPSNGGNAIPAVIVAGLREASRALTDLDALAGQHDPDVIDEALRAALALKPSNGNESGLREALDNLVGPGAQHEHTCDKAEHDEDGACIYCQARAALAGSPANESGLREALGECITEPGSMAERSHKYALRRLAAITETARAALAGSPVSPSKERQALERIAALEYEDIQSAPDIARDALNCSPVSPSLVDAIAAVEAAHFRTIHDTGANPAALTVLNCLRSQAGLPSVSKDDLSRPDGGNYVRPEGSKLLPLNT